MSDEAQNAVAPEPKVFVGQVPVDSTEEQLRELMQTHGEVQSVTIPRKSDSRRFAMVTFAKWAHAESAVDALQGTCSLGGLKPLVVRFADPPKGDDARGIFPKKLFVGQIPKELADTEVRGWFEPYGSIVSIVVKRNPKAANIAFVLYEKWAAAEEAMEALNGTMQTPGAANPLVVKFADGKAKAKPAANGSGVGMKRGSEAEASALSKRMNLGGAGAGPGSMRGGMGAMGPMRGMGAGYGGAGGGYGGAAGGYGGAAGGYGAAGGGYGGAGGGYGGGYRDAQAGMGMWGQQEDQMMGGMGGMGGMGMGPGVYVPMQMGGGQGMYGEQMGGGMGGMGGGMGGMGGGMGGGGMGAMGGGGMGGMGGMRNDYGMHGGGGMGVMSGGMAPMGMGGGMMGGGSPGVGGGGMYGMGGGGAGGGAPAAPAAGGGDMRKCPWKLFVGQLPFSATEDEITAFFGQFGEVVECKVLRKSDGSGASRGCGFVTFAHEEQAAVAMSTVNQRMALPGHSRMLIVHTAKS